MWVAELRGHLLRHRIPIDLSSPELPGSASPHDRRLGPIQHAHAHVVINPRDMSPRQRAELKRVLLSIESGQDDEEADAG